MHTDDESVTDDDDCAGDTDVMDSSVGEGRVCSGVMEHSVGDGTDDEIMDVEYSSVDDTEIVDVEYSSVADGTDSVTFANIEPSTFKLASWRQYRQSHKPCI